MKATATPTEVNLTWNAGAPGTGCAPPATLAYNVFRGTASGGELSTPINSTPVVGLAYSDTANLVSGTTYWYYVETVALCGTLNVSSPPSKPDVSVTFPPPNAPTNAQLVWVHPYPGVLIQWNASTTQGQVFYNAYRDLSGSNAYVKLNSSPLVCSTAACQYYDNSPPAGNYNYAVTSWMPSAGESGFSNKIIWVMVP